MSLNKIMLIGRVGSDPEIITTAGGATICNFNLATNESYNNKEGEKITNTEWHRIVAFGKQGEVLEKYLNKGSQVYVEGKIKTSEYQKDGEKRYSTSIEVRNFTFLGDGSKGDSKPKPQAQPDYSSDLPFED